MPGQAPIVGDERDALRVFLDYHQGGYFAIAYGLTDEQARSTPSVSALSIGGLIKHATGVQKGWMERVAAAPDFPPPDPRPVEEQIAAYQDEYVMREDETLDQLLDGFRKQNAETLRILDEADLDTPVPVPQDVPWFPKGLDHWTVRWVIHHLINELARHSGHADIIRESIDGQKTMG
jgi:uncharacterized damage-inducible protein DinB